MKRKKLSVLAVCLALLLGLLAGCGGGDEAEITAEDFCGCWEYADYDMWVCFYDDGTFEWYSDGLDSTGTYSMDGVELHLDDDSERFFVTDGEGGLMDWDGDALFASELPDTWDDEEGLGAPDYEPVVNAEDFYGVWEYANQDVWVYISGDGTYEWIAQGALYSSSYHMDGAQLCLDAWTLSFTLDGEGNLIDSDGEVLFASELPDFYYDMTEDGDDGWDDEDWDDEDYGSTVSSDDFVGCWEYTDTYTWVCIYGDGTYEWYDSDGLDVIFCPCREKILKAKHIIFPACASEAAALMYGRGPPGTVGSRGNCGMSRSFRRIWICILADVMVKSEGKNLTWSAPASKGRARPECPGECPLNDQN